MLRDVGSAEGASGTVHAMRGGGSGKISLLAAAAVYAFAVTIGLNASSLAQPTNVSLENQASAYIQFREDVAEIEATPFTSAEVTRAAHRLLAAHNSDDLSSGWVAYSALLVAETEAFSKGIRDQVKSRKRKKGTRLKGRDALLANLSEDASFARTLPGANEAIERVLTMTVNDGARIMSLGESFKTQAYSMQKTKWGKKRISSGTQRLSEAQSFANDRVLAPAPMLQSTEKGGVWTPLLAEPGTAWSPQWGEGDAGAASLGKNADVIMDRVLNLAARYSIDALNPKFVEVYAKNTKSDRCLSLSVLTLKQCIAATRMPYEEAFCLGEHGLNDVAGCIGWVADSDTDGA